MPAPRRKPVSSRPSKQELEALVSLIGAGRLEQAITRAQTLARQYPTSAPVLNILGTAHLRARQFTQAVDALSAAVRLAPRDHSALCNLGTALKELGRLEEAETSLHRAIALKPDFFPAHFNLANALRENGQLDEAVPAYQRALTLSPKDARAHYNLGLTLHDLGKFAQAEASYRQAIDLAPAHAQAFGNLGNVLLEQDRPDEAVAAHRHAVELSNGEVLHVYNLGRALEDLGSYDEAETTYRQAISRDAAHVSAQFNLALLDLRRGQFPRGWRAYEWRKRKPDGVPDSRFAIPAWTGREDLHGKSIFLHSEQGFGDTFQFIRYALLVRGLGANVIVGVQPPLVPLLSGSLPGIQIVAGDSAPRQCDYHAALMSLPLAFGTNVATVPALARYLTAEPSRAEAWRERLGTQGFRIGICWQGSTLPIDRGRSLPLAEFEPIARIPGVRLISLHKGAGESQLGGLPSGMNVEVQDDTFDARGHAFMDTAAVIENCDLVITSDNAVAHLAGALGRPVWVVLKSQPDWRWMIAREDSPWYPSMRLFRQMAAGDWPDVFDRIARALAPLVSSRQDAIRPKGE